MLDINKIKSRLNSLTNTTQKSNLMWKPTGKHLIRIVPYKFQTDTPFIELKFHYGVNSKTYLSPDSFNRPDPIVEFSNKLKRTGNKEDWQQGKKLEPKMRTYVPILVRGEEAEGVKFWGFGKQVYQELLKIISDPDFGDITDLKTGHDITVEFTEAAGPDAFPKTSILVKPKPTPAIDTTRKDLVAALENQTDILELFPELSYEELKKVADAWLKPDDDGDDAVSTASSPAKESSSPSAAQSKTNKDDLDSKFKEIFNS